MRQHRKLVILLAFIITIGSVILVNWYITIEIRRVKQTIFATKTAIEQLNMDETIKYLAPEYQDHWGFNHDSVYQFGKNIFTQTKSIEITIDNLEVLVDEQNALAKFEVKVKVVLSNELYSRLEVNDVFRTGKEINPMRLQLRKSPENKWLISNVDLVEEQ
jgi:hypothetical protein